MSILIKALKQAEREHLARAASAGSTVPEDLEPAPRMSGSLSLEPVELQTRGTETASPYPGLAAAETPAAAALSTALSSSPSSSPSSSASADPAAALPADRSPHADAAAGATIDPTLPAPGRIPVRPMPATPVPATPVPASSRTGQAPVIGRAGPAAAAAAPAAPAATSTSAKGPAATPDRTDAAGEQRKAARQLLSPAPASGGSRRAFVVAALIVALAGAGAGAYWLGLIPDLSLPAPRTATAAAGSGLPAPVSLAERLAHRPGASAARPPAGAPGAGNTGATGAGHAALPAAPAIAPVAGSTRDSGTGSRASAAAYPASNAATGAARGAATHAAADGIHLRSPEVATDRVRALLQQGYDAAGRGDATVARLAYEQVLELDHNNGDAWIGLAALAANGGDAAGANRDYRHALEIDPGDTVALGGLLGLQAGGDPQEAEARLRALIVRDGAQPALQTALGKLLARQGRWLDAQETFFQAWTADPTQPDVAFNLAVSLEHIRQPALAAQFYARALDLAQGHGARFDKAVARARIAALVPIPAPKQP